MNDYVDSVLNFTLADGGAGAQFLAHLRSELDQYQTIESEILQAFVPATAELSREVGLRLVQTCCTTFEEQIKVLDVEHPLNLLDDLSSAVLGESGERGNKGVCRCGENLSIHLPIARFPIYPPTP